MIYHTQIYWPDPKLLKTMRLRKEDERELKTAANSKDIHQALAHAINQSDCTYMTMDNYGKFIALWGYTYVEGNGRVMAAPWMVGSDKIKKYKRQFVMMSAYILDELLDKADVLFNWVDSRNDTHIKWLKRVGFKFDQKKDVTKRGVPFRFFYKHKEV